MIFYEPVSPERMKDYVDKTKELNRLLVQKIELEHRMSGVNSPDLSKIKVISGNGNKTSAQERLAMRLERVDKEIEFFKHRVFGVYGLEEEHRILTTQISRIPNTRYRKVIVWRYLEGWKFKEIIEEFFWDKPDFEEEKKGKYKDFVMYWHRRALEELEKLSAKPYVPVTRQITLEDETC